ncbi:MAG: hypothetical protein AAF191_00340, partial [Verrucomicrobiota bacterium]
MSLVLSRGMGRDLKERVGYDAEADPQEERRNLEDHVNLLLASGGHPAVDLGRESHFLEMGKALLANFQERTRLLSDYLCPADQSVQDYLADVLKEVEGVFEPGAPMLPTRTLVFDRHGISRTLSLPARSDLFESNIVSSYRVDQGVCHNPKSDRRTTKGVFHVVEGGLPVPADKKEVPKKTFARLLQEALRPPHELMTLPFTAEEETPVATFVSTLLRPLVCPKVDGVVEEKTMEVRFFAPGNLASNLDFVESIFGNAGDPYLPENDARLDVEHWSGHTGCVILAPHLVTFRKKEMGLPHVSEATERQKRDGMCWESEEEIYNDGTAFKVTCRDKRGIVVTLIADNYFGYCKKEVKTQISYAANLYGLAEEEHAGGAIAFPSFDLGEDFSLSGYHQAVDHQFSDMVALHGERMEIMPEGHGRDRRFPDILYVPETVTVDLHSQKVSWEKDGQEQTLALQPDKTYVLPSGYKVEMVKPTEGQRWRLIGTNAEGTVCHKPCTVSGGGKSEISKSLADAMEGGSVFVPDFSANLSKVEEVIHMDYGKRFKNPYDPDKPSRRFLDPGRSLGSVIRLLATSPDYTEEYNEWILSIPRPIRDLCLTIKRYWKEDWGDDWLNRFRVDTVDGMPGYELKYRNQRVIARYLRIGFHKDGSWRTYGLRKDFHQSFKLQREDDITASITVPSDQVAGMHPDVERPSVKFVENCEFRLFQRPDDAIHRGYDKATERDFGQDGRFFSNYEPITRAEAKEMVEDTIRFEQ